MMILALAVPVLYLLLICPTLKRPDDSRLRGWLYAHRGLHDGNGKAPENSMEAFRRAMENGYGMELDVQLTRDGKLIVHHDGDLKRVCSVDRRIRDTDYADLPLLPDGSRIPLLSEVLSLVDGRAPVIVEIKHHGGAVKNAAAAWDILKNYQGPYCVEAFHPMAMRYFRRHAPHVIRGQLASGGRWNPRELSYPAYVAMKYLLVNVLSRPHFVAYSVPEDRSIAPWLMKHVFKPYLACWTLRSQQTLNYAKREGYRYPIFELFTPEKGI